MAAATTPESFWRRVDRSGGPVACWPWTGPEHGGGYAKVRFIRLTGARRKVFVHRVAWALAHGRWPTGQVLHHCDNPPCCNPAHLYEGDPARNAQDREDRGRAGSSVGENVRRYSEADYANVKALAGEIGNLAEVSRRTGISRSHVRRIVSGEQT